MLLKNLLDIYSSVGEMINNVNDSVVSVSSAAEELNVTGQNVLDMCRTSSESIVSCNEDVENGKKYYQPKQAEHGRDIRRDTLYC